MTHEQYKDAAQYWGKKASASMPEAELKNACRDQRIVLGFQGWARQQTDNRFLMIQNGLTIRMLHLIQQSIAEKVGVPCGNLILLVKSAHFYIRDRNKVLAILHQEC